MNITDYTEIGYYVIKYVSVECTLQEDTICDGKISTAGEIAVKDQYMNCMK